MSKLRIGLCPSLTDVILIKLHSHAIYSVSDLLDENVEDLARLLHISCKEVAAMRRILLAQFSAFPVCAADLYDEITKSVSILSTGCSKLDSLLDGGIYTMEVTEIVGELSAGKTQFCLVVTLTLSQTAKQRIIWVDTCGSFDVGRLQLMLEEKGTKEEELESVYERIQVKNAFDAMDLLSVLEDIKIELAAQDNINQSCVRLVVVDCITAVLSPLMSGLGSDGHGLMMQVAQSLKCLATEYCVAVLVTNSLVGGDNFVGKKPALGRTWASIPNNRLLLQREDTHKINQQGEVIGGKCSNVRTATLVKSCRQESGVSVQFVISDQGMEDILGAS